MTAETTKILETTISPDTGGQIVRIQIADVSLADLPDATVHLTLIAKPPAYNAPMLAHVQREAIDAGHTALSLLLEELASEIRTCGRDLRPGVKK